LFGYRCLPARSYSATNNTRPLLYDNKSVSKTSLSSGSSNASSLTASSSTDLLRLPVQSSLPDVNHAQFTSAPPPSPSALPFIAWSECKPTPLPPPPSLSSSTCDSDCSQKDWKCSNNVVPSPPLSRSNPIPSEKLFRLSYTPLSSDNSCENLHSKPELKEDFLYPPSQRGYESDCSAGSELSEDEWTASSSLGDSYDSLEWISTSTTDSSLQSWE